MCLRVVDITAHTRVTDLDLATHDTQQVISVGAGVTAPLGKQGKNRLT